jgi:xylan 1,4-beta-xylosidase
MFHLPPGRKIGVIGYFIWAFVGLVSAQDAVPLATHRPATFCNPLDLDYRFQLKDPSRREAADPTIVRFQDEFWLFASKSGGYWHSKDFAHWTFVAPTGLPLENYAPSVEVIGGKLYFVAGSSRAIFTTDDPAVGHWTKVSTIDNYTDPDLFSDDDGHVYMYFGTSAKDPIMGAELDPANHFAQVGPTVNFFGSDSLHHGWELKKLEATDAEIAKGSGLPFLEGSWMTKHAGTYYLQYAAPGTERKWYGDGVYTSSHPLGPFIYAPYSPFAQRSTGFLGGIGHGSICQDGEGNYWHADTALIGIRASFERRVAIFPAGFVPVGSGPDQLVCQSYLGDYPQYAPGGAAHPLVDNSPGWMLLSYKKAATASSSLPTFPPEQAFDEDIRTWWSAATGNPGEWLAVDLGKRCQIQAVQINFADQGSTVLGKMINDAYQYVLEVSDDEKNWTTCISRKDNVRDAPHEYVQLEQPVMARYVRLTNVHTPAGADFSVSGLRLFGSGMGQPPARVDGLAAQRLPERRHASLSWNAVADADFYIIRYGIAPDRLFSNVQIYGQTTYNLPGLNTDVVYYATVDAVNDSGIMKGTQTVEIK